MSITAQPVSVTIAFQTPRTVKVVNKRNLLRRGNLRRISCKDEIALVDITLPANFDEGEKLRCIG